MNKAHFGETEWEEVEVELSEEPGVRELEEMLQARNLLPKKQLRRKKTGVCQWSGGACGVIETDLHYHQSAGFSGWICPECAWLAQQAEEAIERDNS